MRRGTVAFSSQPDLEPGGARQSLADIYKLQQWRRDTEGPSRLGVFQRLFSLFGSRPNSRKTSTASFTGVASALRVHMGYIAGLVPGTKASSSCQVNVQGTRQPHPRCGSGPIISITSDEDRRFSLGLRRKESSEPRVNFSLPKSSTSHGSSREKVRGSPRFPHRIVPANSLSAITPGSIRAAHYKWHSMDDASKRKVANTTQRGFFNGPNDDVWATHETGIPLSELLNSARGRKPPDLSALTIPADSNLTSPEDALLGSDLRKLFRVNGAVDGSFEDNCTIDGDSTIPKYNRSCEAPNFETVDSIDRDGEIDAATNFRGDHSENIETLSSFRTVAICENRSVVTDEIFAKETSTEVPEDHDAREYNEN